jgi:hypothetical protein
MTLSIIVHARAEQYADEYEGMYETHELLFLPECTTYQEKYISSSLLYRQP